MFIGAIAVAISAPILAAAATAETEGAWICTEVVDGDTIRVESPDGSPVTLHLFGVDAPELDQDRGLEAKAFVEDRALGRAIEVTLKIRQADASIAVVAVDGRDLAAEITAAGLAWLTRDGDTADEYAIAVFTARAGKLALWSDVDPIHPSQWRAQRSTVHPPSAAPRKSLSEYAASTRIAAETGEPIVVSDIPSALTRDRETRLFVESMLEIANAAVVVTTMEETHSRHCSGGSRPIGDAGTVWSEDMQAWIRDSGTAPDEACQALLLDIDRGRALIEAARREAVEDARRFGVEEPVIQEVVAYVGLGGP